MRDLLILVSFGGGGSAATEGCCQPRWIGLMSCPVGLVETLDLGSRVQGGLLVQVGGNYCAVPSCTVRLTKTAVPRATLYGTDAASLCRNSEPLPLSVRCKVSKVSEAT